MDKEQAQQLGQHLRQARNSSGLSARDLSALIDVSDATILRIEQGTIMDPTPDKLRQIAEALELSVADVFAMAGYNSPAELPTLTPYLRTKYGQLPPDAMLQIENYATKIARRHGVSMTGPAPGEDEARPATITTNHNQNDEQQ